MHQIAIHHELKETGKTARLNYLEIHIIENLGCRDSRSIGIF